MNRASGGSRFKIILVFCICFVLFATLTFFGVQFFTKTGVFRVPGVVIYDESLSDGEVALIQSVFDENLDLDKDVTISATNYLELPELGEGEFISTIAVPVADFYSDEADVVAENADALFNNCLDCYYKVVDIDELDFKSKLLSINGHYYLDEFDKGAIYRIIKFESEKYAEEIQALASKLYSDKTWPGKDTVLSFAQTGVTALSRRMNGKLAEVGDATYFAAQIGKYLSGFDLTHTSNEASFSEYATNKNICSNPKFGDTLLAIGLDIVELTGNHNQDCGDTDAASTIDFYTEHGIKIVGGGKTASDAAVPLEINAEGNHITMLAYNESTGGATLDNTPGANQYYEDLAVAQISEAKKRGDFVIVDIQYYECNAYASEYEDPACDRADSSAGDQVGFFRRLIDLGADMVVGTSAHQPQTYELYGNGVIYYGLGNLFFDQVWWPGTTRSLILANYFYNGKLLQTKVVPTVYDETMQTKLLDEEKSRWLLNRLKSVRP